MDQRRDHNEQTAKRPEKTWPKKWYEIEFLIIINQSSVMRKHSSNLVSVASRFGSTPNTKKWLAVLRQRFSAILVGCSMQQTKNNMYSTHKQHTKLYKHTSNDGSGWMRSLKNSIKQKQTSNNNNINNNKRYKDSYSVKWLNEWKREMDTNGMEERKAERRKNEHEHLNKTLKIN